MRSLDRTATQVRVEDTLDRAHALGDDLRTLLDLPLDDDDNYIADCWDYNEGAATDDEESLEDMGDPNYPGDGLTRYEEYRGFMALGQHIRTNPDDDQDIFLIDQDDVGEGFLANSGLTLQLIDLTEVGIDLESPTGHHDPTHGPNAGDDDCIMITEADPRWYDSRSIFCTEAIPDNPGTPEEVETGDCLHTWRLHD